MDPPRLRFRDSTRLLLRAALPRWWALIPGGLLGLTDVAERVAGGPVSPPMWSVLLFLVGGVIFALLLAHHDIRLMDARRTQRAQPTVWRVLARGRELRGVIDQLPRRQAHKVTSDWLEDLYQAVKQESPQHIPVINDANRPGDDIDAWAKHALDTCLEQIRVDG